MGRGNTFRDVPLAHFFGESKRDPQLFSLSPSDGERVRERGSLQLHTYGLGLLRVRLRHAVHPKPFRHLVML